MTEHGKGGIMPPVSGVSIKVPSDLAEEARDAASLADRSLTGQIEHWVKLGRAAELALRGSAAQALKSGATDTKNQDSEEIADFLASLRTPGVATQLALASGFLDDQVSYEPDPQKAPRLGSQ